MLAYAQDPGTEPIAEAPSLAIGAKDLPAGTIRKTRISRVICGGNLISGYAHSRDLTYVSDLLKHYFSDDKILETFRICEANGVNTAMLKFDPDTVRILKKYWNERGGKIQWIAQIVNPGTIAQDAERAIEMGAIGVFTTGQMGDELVRTGHVDQLAKAVQTIQDNKALAGVSCHELEVILACEKEGIKPDFYMKTFHHKKYWSALPNGDRNDNLFEENAERTIEVMKGVVTPLGGLQSFGGGRYSRARRFYPCHRERRGFHVRGYVRFPGGRRMSKSPRKSSRSLRSVPGLGGRSGPSDLRYPNVALNKIARFVQPPMRE